MNDEDIFHSFPGIGNVIASDFVPLVLYLHIRDIVYRDIKPTKVSVSNYRYKSYKLAFGKKRMVCKLGDLTKARSMYAQTNALTRENFTNAVHRRSLVFMVPELIIED